MPHDYKHTMLKMISIFSVVRGYNITLIVLAQYLASIFIMGYQIPLIDVLLDAQLFLIVLATVGSVAAGYIINNFYDFEKDLINRPHKSKLDRVVSQRTKLSLYVVLNGVVLFLMSFVSMRAVLFFGSYVFAIWLYSHKLKKLPVLGNLTSAFLSITPFFAILLYFQNYNELIFILGFYLFLILSIRELVKDLENIKGDLALDYKTVPVVHGEKLTKQMITLLIGLNLIVTVLILYYFSMGLMIFFFGGSIVALIVSLAMVWKAQSSRQYNRIHILIKGLIFAGVLSIMLLNPSLIIDKLF